MSTTRTYRTYDRDYKLGIIKSYLASGLSASDYSKKHGLIQTNLVRWVLEYKAGGEDGVRASRQARAPKAPKARDVSPVAAKLDQLEQRLTRIETQLFTKGSVTHGY